MQDAKGWTAQEEQAFCGILAVSRLTRIEAIQLWKRCHKSMHKALRVAQENYPPLTNAQLSSIERLKTARNRVTLRAETDHQATIVNLEGSTA